MLKWSCDRQVLPNGLPQDVKPLIQSIRKAHTDVKLMCSGRPEDVREWICILEDLIETWNALVKWSSEKTATTSLFNSLQHCLDWSLDVAKEADYNHSPYTLMHFFCQVADAIFDWAKWWESNNSPQKSKPTVRKESSQFKVGSPKAIIPPAANASEREIRLNAINQGQFVTIVVPDPEADVSSTLDYS